jgi:hypothetical protein
MNKNMLFDNIDSFSQVRPRSVFEVQNQHFKVLSLNTPSVVFMNSLSHRQGWKEGTLERGGGGDGRGTLATILITRWTCK